MTSRTITILGSGMSAAGAAHAALDMGYRPIVYDSAHRIGGHAKTHVYKNNACCFLFDEGPHVSFTTNERIQNLLSDSINKEYETVSAKVDNYWNGYRIKHPVITNLHGLPVSIIDSIIHECKELSPNTSVENFEQWLIASYGATYAKLFPMVYGKKYHTTDTANLNTDHVGPRLYKANLPEIIAGASSAVTKDVHYIQRYRYPVYGGFQSYINALFSGIQVHTSCFVTRIYSKSKEIEFLDGSRTTYETLVSSIPLDRMAKYILADAPLEIREAGNRLACTNMVLVNLGVNRSNISDSSWSYSYDEEVPFTRLSFPHIMSPHTTPPGMSSVQAEIYYSSKYKPNKDNNDLRNTKSSLLQYGILRDTDQIELERVMHIPYANVIYDFDRAPAVKVIHEYMDSIGIGYCGRYGEWNHLWTDEAFLSGEKAAAQKIG